MFINHGDKNFFNYGCLVDAEHSNNVIRILYCRPYDDEEDLFLFADCEVDVTDSWIEKDKVIDFTGIDEESADLIDLAIGCVEYYGVENFSSPYNGYQFNRKEIENMLKHYLIATDDLDITW